MPTIHSSQRRGSSERTFQLAMEWTRRIVQLAGVAAILLYAYLFYGLFMGDVGHWSSLSHDDKVRIASNVAGAVNYLNFALGILILGLCIMSYDEEILGYGFIAGSVALYYGLPFLVDMLLAGQMTEWQSTKNLAALTIFNQFKVLSLMLAVPGGILAMRDLVLRIVDGSSRKREQFATMQYGGAVKEEAAPGSPVFAAFAKCWQLPFCRPQIRRNCPIYHARTKCWKERVGCMCEENVVRHAMDAIIGKELIQKEEPLIKTDESFVRMGEPNGDLTQSAPAENKTVELPPRAPSSASSPKNVKIPHNPNLSAKVKAERCRNCVIFNEHQRAKYQILAPIFVLGVPGLAILKIDDITAVLNHVLRTMDQVMSHLSLANGSATPKEAVSGMFSGAGFAQYIVIGCLVVILTTMSLRFLEYIMFKLKI